MHLNFFDLFIGKVTLSGSVDQPIKLQKNGWLVQVPGKFFVELIQELDLFHFVSGSATLKWLQQEFVYLLKYLSFIVREPLQDLEMLVPQAIS